MTVPPACSVAQVGSLLDEITGPLSSFTADGAHDQDGLYTAVADRHLEAAVTVPPRRTAVLSDIAAIAPSATSISGASPRAAAGPGKKPPATTGAPRSRRRSDDGNR
jgi:hypothetical protein